MTPRPLRPSVPDVPWSDRLSERCCVVVVSGRRDLVSGVLLQLPCPRLDRVGELVPGEPALLEAAAPRADTPPPLSLPELGHRPGERAHVDRPRTPGLGEDELEFEGTRQ